MEFLFKEILELQQRGVRSKRDQLVNGVINCINDGKLKRGDRLPSINNMVNGVGFARKTIVRAYDELKSRGIVESENFKGFYIASTNTQSKLKVALLMYSFRAFQEDFYNTFREELGEDYQIDIFFHHHNTEVFKSTLETIEGKYGMYVIAPIPNEEITDILKKIPADKLLIVDRFIDVPVAYSYISQEFEQSTYKHLKNLLPEIKKYKKTVLFYREDQDYPLGIKLAFDKFIKETGLVGSVATKYTTPILEKGAMYFFISDTGLGQLLKDATNATYKIGEDIGVLTHNDNDLKEVIFGGITTFSADFRKMAVESAQFVKDRKIIQKIIPSEIKRRSSL
ncbi:GntR family transcriptional regulator [Wenyingzhuangia sp. IMCC45574]